MGLNSGAGSINVAVAFAVQPLASVINTEYDPAQSCVMLFADCPVAHTYVYGAVPLVGVTAMLPLQSPLHNGFVATMVGGFNTGGPGTT